MKLGLFSKLFLLSAACIMVAMLITDALVRRSWEHSFEQQLRNQLEEKARGLRESLPPVTGCAPRNAAALSGLKEELSRQAAALNLRITVVDHCGSVLADSSAEAERMENHAQRLEFRAALERGAVGTDTRTSHTLDVPFLYVALPLRGAQPAGAVRVSYPLDQIRVESSRIRNLILLASLIALTVALLLAALAARLISGRSQRIMEFARRVAAGDLSARVRDPSTDELSELAHALNQTAQQLENSFRDLDQSRARFEALLNSMQEPVLAVSPDRKVQWFNSQMAKIAGSALKIDAPLVESIRDPEVTRAIRQTLETREIASARSELISPGRVFNIVVAPVGSEGVVAVLAEITHIEKTEKVRRDFVANVSHELRTPLTSIQGYTETLLENAPAGQRDFLEIIRKNAKRMARLTDDLLTLARVESGEDALRFQLASPSQVLADIFESFEETARLQGRSFIVDCRTDKPVRCDPDKIHQVMSNLVENAFKYGSPSTGVTLGAENDVEGVRFYVSDQGDGIPSEHLSRLFERFYRVDKSRSQDSGGTGLGLAIVKHIVLKHGGSVKVESELGKGSVFSFVLPEPNAWRMNVTRH